MHTQTSVQFSCSVVSDSLRPQGLQHARLPCPSPTPGAYSNSCPSSWWCHPIISATVRSWSHFSWLYRASPSLAEYNQSDFSIDHLVMSMCRVVSCVVGRGCLLWPVHSLGKIASLCPASFCTPRPNLPVTSGIFWLPTFVFQSPIMKRTSFLGVSSRR